MSFRGEEAYEISIELKSKLTREVLSDFHSEIIKVYQEYDMRKGLEPVDYAKETYWGWFIFAESTLGYGRALEATLLKHEIGRAHV